MEKLEGKNDREGVESMRETKKGERERQWGERETVIEIEERDD